MLKTNSGLGEMLTSKLK